MQRAIKISSEQGTFDTSGNNNLCDFIIPAGSGSLMLDESYINVNIRLSRNNTVNPEAVYNNSLVIDDGAVDHMCRQSVEMVRNVEMVSQQYGNLESVKDVNKIRGNLLQYQKSVAEKDFDIDALTTDNFRTQFKPKPYTELYSLGSEQSRYRNHDVKIKLKDLMNVCSTNNYDTSGGDTRLHLEFEFQKLKIKTDHLVDYNSLELFGTGDNFNKMVDPVGNVPAELVSSFTTKISYVDMVDSPWYVNMPVNVNGKIGAAGLTPLGANSGANVITRIEKDATTDKLVLSLKTAVGTSGQTLTGVEITPDNANIDAIQDPNVNQIIINKVELISYVNPNPEKIPLIYSTYMAQNDSYAAANSASRNYTIPPLTRNVYIIFDTDIQSNEAHLSTYRITVDNKQVVNRDVHVRSPLHYELIQQVFTNNNAVLHNITERFNNVISSLNRGGAGERLNSRLQNMIMFPVKFKQVEQRLVVELNAAATQDLVGRHAIYMEIVRSKQ